MTKYLLQLCAPLTLAMLTLAGCEGIGRAVVDELGDGQHRAAMCYGETANCQNVVAEVPLLTPPQSVALGLEQCASTRNACPTGRAAPGAAGPSYPNAVGCSLELALPEGDSSNLGRASCVVAQLSPVAPARLIRLANVDMTESVLTLASETPLVVELVRASLTSTQITLRGPVTLRVLDQSAMNNVWLVEQPANNGIAGASFELVEGRAQGLTVNLLGGHVTMLRSILTNSKLWADDVVLETLAIADVSVASPELDAVELSGRALTLQVGRATLAQLELTDMSVQRCDSMLIVASRISKSSFAACTDKLRVDFSGVSDSLLVGAIESSVGTWTQNAFGVGGAATNLELWGGSQLSNRYCAGVSRASFGHVQTFECNACDELPMPEQRLCPAAMPSEQEPPALILPEDNPFCPILAELQTLPPCAPPVRNENPTNPF